MREIEEFPAEVRAGIVFHPVKTMDEALRVALRSATGKKAAAAAQTHASAPH